MILTGSVFAQYDWGGTALIIFGAMLFLLRSDNECFHEIKRDRIIESFMNFLIYFAVLNSSLLPVSVCNYNNLLF